ncbi:MAG: metal-dependent hydrolase, partial [Candidatus Hodarchaeota archaeon]
MDLFTHITVSVAIVTTLSHDEDSQRAFIIGGMAPDVDVLISWLSTLIPQLFFLQHRGLFHAVLVAPVITMVLIFLTKYSERFNYIKRFKERFQEMYTEFNSKTVFWGVLGSLIHLFMDFITQGGLHLFYPLIYQRISISTISVFDPLITIISSIIVLRFVYSKFMGSSTYSLSQVKKSVKLTSILFVILLIVYGLLQVNTVVVQSPISTTPDSIPIFRWVVSEENNFISI